MTYQEKIEEMKDNVDKCLPNIKQDVSELIRGRLVLYNRHLNIKNVISTCLILNLDYNFTMRIDEIGEYNELTEIESKMLGDSAAVPNDIAEYAFQRLMEDEEFVLEVL